MRDGPLQDELCFHIHLLPILQGIHILFDSNQTNSIVASNSLSYLPTSKDSKHDLHIL